MEQVSKFVNGNERDYTKIDGPSGPLVYPVIHVYIYSVLYYLTTIPNKNPNSLTCTDGVDCKYEVGVDIGTAQLYFAALYLVTLAVVIACYRRVNAPPWLLVPLVLSKRLHSIFLLRLFNDGWVALAFWVSVYALQRRIWSLGAAAWCFGLGVKMSMLLAAPALGAILIQGAGTSYALLLGYVSALSQLLLALPFIWEYAWEYVGRAFELNRKFLFVWTVNWRFLGKETFESSEFSTGLLVLHATLLLTFLHWKWVRATSKGIVDFALRWAWRPMSEEEQDRLSQKITPVFVMDTMLGSMVIGLLCARSLHYQFYAYLGWMSPYLLWRGGSHPVWVLLNWAVQEYCWLVFPSTNLSSALVVFQLTLQMLSVLIAPPVDHVSPPAKLQKDTKAT